MCASIKKEQSSSKKEFSIHDYLKDGNIAFYGYKPKVFPEFIFGDRKGRTKIFLRHENAHLPRVGDFPVFNYSSLSEIRDQLADVYFLDNEAVKVLFAEFPGASQYVLIRFIPRLSWLIALPGLIRRLYIGLVKIEGIIKLDEGGRTKRWIVLRHMLKESLNTGLSLSSEVGIQGFLDYLRNEKIKHVILRFYEKLPELNRKGGDLDILVTDEDDQRIRDFLQDNPGPIGVDVWTVSRTKHNSITYFPPPIARKIIDSAVNGPAGSMIPAPRQSFLSLAYHALYHKGIFAGIASSMTDIVVNKHPENDYAGVLKRMAKDLGIKVEITMESLDKYLGREGWRPKIDTLAKIAPHNKWVWKRFFSTGPLAEVGLGVFILKKKAFDLGISDSILQTISNYEGFKILRTKKFNDDEVKYVSDSLRGGVWKEASDHSDDFLPATAVLILDTNIARSHKMNVAYNNPDKGIVNLKKKILRREFDTGKISLVHSTDNTDESWEYITVCFPNELEDIKKDIANTYDGIQLSLSEKIKLYIASIPRYLMYRFAIFKQKTKKRIVDWAVK